MRKHYSYPSIPQFNMLLSDLRHSARYVGKTEDNKPKYDNNLPLPELFIDGTVKLHGSNCSVVLTREGDFYPQSREIVLTEEVTCDGFYQFAMDRKHLFISLLTCHLMAAPEDVKAVVLYGEWAGRGIQKKVAIAELDPFFATFDLRYIDSTYEQGGTGFINTKLNDFHWPMHRMYSIHAFKTWAIKLDVANPEAIQDALRTETLGVQLECPVGKAFGVEGTGEGIVWTVAYNGKKHRMKVKGQKHSSTKVKELAPVDTVKVNSINEFIEYAITENRMNQGLDVMRKSNQPITRENTNIFIKWVFADVMKEEKETLAKSNITTKDIASKGNYKIRQFYMSHVV